MEAMQQKGCEWTAVQTAVTGKMHLKKKIVCQDKTFVYETSDVFAAALADGASSAVHSELGFSVLWFCISHSRSSVLDLTSSKL